LWTAYLSPAALRKLDDPMFLGPWRVPNWVPLRWRHAAWQILDRWKLEPMARGALATLAMTLGAKPLEGSVFGDWIHSPMAAWPSTTRTLRRCLGACTVCWTRRLVGRSCTGGFPQLRMGAGGRSVSAEIH
jgi:hypothetical protein